MEVAKASPQVRWLVGIFLHILARYACTLKLIGFSVITSPVILRPIPYFHWNIGLIHMANSFDL
jgi:hypothetical protein